MNKLVKLSVAQVTYNYYLGWKSELFQLTESIFFTFLRSQCRNIKNVFVLPSTDVTFSFCQTYIAQYSHWLDSFISSIVRSIMRYSYTVIFILPLESLSVFWGSHIWRHLFENSVYETWMVFFQNLFFFTQYEKTFYGEQSMFMGERFPSFFFFWLAMEKIF